MCGTVSHEAAKTLRHNTITFLAVQLYAVYLYNLFYYTFFATRNPHGMLGPFKITLPTCNPLIIILSLS